MGYFINKCGSRQSSKNFGISTYTVILQVPVHNYNANATGNHNTIANSNCLVKKGS